MAIILIILILYLVITFASILTLCPDWKEYKRVYKQLPSKRWEKIGDNYYEKDSYSFIWFTKMQGFKLKPAVYLQNSWCTFLDPYSWYWFVKYKRWFKNEFPKIKK